MQQQTNKFSLHCALSLAAQCIVIGPVCVFACLWVCYRAPGKGVCGGAKFFDSALLQPARNVCVSLGAFLIMQTIPQYTAFIFNLLMK